MGVLIEHQARMGQHELSARGTHGELYDPYFAVVGALSQPDGGATSILGAYENLVESVELALRYAYHRGEPTSPPGKLLPKHPFGDEDLRRHVVAASIWRTLVEDHGAVKYGMWTSHRFACDHTCLAPPDLEEYRRWRVGEIREHSVSIEFNCQLLYAGLGDDLAIRTLAAHVKVPPPGRIWDGNLPHAALQSAVKGSCFYSAATLWVRFRHFESLARDVHIAGTRLDWSSWLLARSVLQVIAEALRLSSGAILPQSEDDWTRLVFIARPKDVARLLRSGGLSDSAAADSLKALTFDRSRRSLEIWDQPLLPIGECLLLVPGLIQAGKPTRSLENCIAQWAPNAAQAKGKRFEESTLSDIAAICPGRACPNVVFNSPGGEVVEIDIVWWWENHLFLIETKCLRSVYSFADFARAKQQIKTALDQLRHRREMMRKHWKLLVDAAPDLELPPECPPAERQMCVALTNILCFSSLASDGVIVSDDLCFRRYFGDPAIKRIHIRPDESHYSAETVGHIRQCSPNPRDFMRYLHAPPQITGIRNRLQERMVQSEASIDGYPVWKLSAEFTGWALDDLGYSPLFNDETAGQ